MGLTKNISRLLTVGILFTGAAAGYYAREMGKLPASAEVRKEMLESPVQQTVKTQNFLFEYRNKKYDVMPLAKYDLYGLVVSHNNISSIADAYHTSDSVDVKDLCVVWGENVLDDLHKKLKFWSETWTCNVSGEREVFRSFRKDQLSNNHLLASTDEIKKAIQATNRGDQVRIEGYLVNYFPVGESERTRVSSLTRSDTGNGACEVVYVTDFEVLTRGTPYAYDHYSFLIKAFLILIGIKLLSWLVFPYLDYKYFE